MGQFPELTPVRSQVIELQLATFSLEKQVGVQWFLRESPLDKCLRESLSGVDKGLWETPNQTTDSGQDKKSRFNKVRTKAQLYRVYRVYIGKRP